MNILETFFILFKSNAAELKKGYEEVKKGTKDVEDNLKNTDKTAQTLGTSFFDLATAATAALGAYFTLGAIKDGILNAASFNAELEKQGKILGILPDDLSAFGGAVATVGGDAAGAVNWLNQLSHTYSQFGRGVKEVIPNLEKLADQYHYLNDQDFFALMRRFQIPDEVILLMRKGGDEMRRIIEQQRELAPLSRENADAAREFETALGNLTRESRNMFQSWGTELLPVLTFAVHGLKEVSDFLGDIFGPMIRETKDSTTGMIDAFTDLGDAFEDFFDKTKIAGYSLTEIFKAIYQSIKPVVDLIKEGIDFINPWSKSGIYSDEEHEKAMERHRRAVERHRNHLALNAPVTGNVDTSNGIYLDDSSAEYKAALDVARRAVGDADKSPFNSRGGVGGGRNTNVQIDTINIETQATNAEELSKALKDSLNRQLRSGVGNFDDGVDR